MKKNNLNLYLFIAIFFLLIKNITAQTNDSVYIPFNNNEIGQISERVFDNSWVEFKEELNLNPISLLGDYKTAFGLSNDDEMLLKRTSTDEIGMQHYHFQQIYKGIIVEGGEYIIHSKNGIAIRGNGKLVENMDLSITPLISKEIALQKAIDTIKIIENITNTNIDTVSYELVFSKIPGSILLIKDNYKLTYKLNISFSNKNYLIYINALNGNILRILKNSYNYSCETGDVYTLYNGWQNFQTYKGWELWVGYYYELRSECGSITTEIWDSDAQGYDNLIDNDNTPNTWTSVDERPATTAHWAAQCASNYFLNVFQRWSIDCNGKKIHLFVNRDFGSGNNFNNIGGYNHDDEYSITIPYEEVGVFSSPATLDIIGHEYTHGVIIYTANFYSDPAIPTESGALEESFCDIFGTMIEYYYGNTNWEMGSECFYSTQPTSYRRSLSNPNIYNDAASYGDNFWTSCTSNWEYVWSGVQNHWFYLLSQAIGIEKAATIAYYNLDHYLTEYSDYSDAKNGSIYFAMDLWGSCSIEAEQTINAWNAVNVTSEGGIFSDYTVDCNSLNTTHANGNTYYANAINNLYINCSINSYPNSSTILTAGNTVRMLPGFKTNGTYFHAYINPCLKNNLKHTNPTVQNQFEDTEENTEKNIEDSLFTINKNLVVIPNPNNGNMQVSYEIPEAETGRLEVYNMIGEKLFSYPLNSGKNTFSISRTDLSEGIYFYRATAGNELIAADKIVVIK